MKSKNLKVRALEVRIRSCGGGDGQTHFMEYKDTYAIWSESRKCYFVEKGDKWIAVSRPIDFVKIVDGK